MEVDDNHIKAQYMTRLKNGTTLIRLYAKSIITMSAGKGKRARNCRYDNINMLT